MGSTASCGSCNDYPCCRGSSESQAQERIQIWKSSNRSSGYTAAAAAPAAVCDVTMPRQVKSGFTPTPCYFPTFCLPMSTFMGLEEMTPYEKLVSDLLVPDRNDGQCMHFVSHEWLGHSHPDPDRVQIQHLQRTFRAFMDGKAKSFFHPDDWDAFLRGVEALVILIKPRLAIL